MSRLCKSNLIFFPIIIWLSMGCADDNVTPLAQPNADFNSNVKTIKQGEAVSFTSTSTGDITDYEWTFEGGTPNSSTDFNPIITYNDTGQFSVTLKVANASSQDIETKINFISVEEIETIANFSSNKTSIRPGESIEFYDESSGEELSFEWTFDGGTPNTSIEQNPIISYENEGVFDVTLSITNENFGDTEVKTGYISVSRSSENELISLSFEEELNNQINFDIVPTITGNNISSIIPFGTSYLLIPTFQVSDFATVKFDNVEVQSGESPIDFSMEVSMTVIAENGNENNYIINIKDTYMFLDQRIENLISQYNIPGVQIAIVRNEKLVYQRPYGLAVEEGSIPISNQSLFRIASISKPITAISIFKLAENNLLNLDDLVFGDGNILGTQYGTYPYPADVEQITVRHLLEHTSGWTNDPFDPMFNNLSDTHSELISDMIDNRPLATIPGSTYYYSNFGYCILGRIIEKISNQTYDQYVIDNILNPIGVTEMRIAGNTLAEQYQNEVQYYDQENFSPYIMNVRRMDSHGGWIASATDLANFLVHIDRNSSKPDIVSSTYLNELYFKYFNWIFYGSLPGTSSGISRINNTFGYTFLINTRTLPDNEILDAMNEILTDEILSISEWPEYDLF